MSESRTLIAETVERLFAESLDAEAIARAEAGEWPATLWSSVEEAGLTRALLRAENGGAGGDWLDVFEIARAVGRHCVPLPLVETILASWLLERGGLAVPDGPLGLIPHDFTPTAGARLERVPWGRTSSHLVGLARDGKQTRVACLPRDGLPCTDGHNLALEPRDDLTLGDAAPTLGDHALGSGTVHRLGALLRCGQMTGALECMLDRSVQYANERVQFGRPIASFQIIQQELARLAGLVAEATTATEIAFGATDRTDPGAEGRIGAGADPMFEIACAKVVVGDAAELGPRIAHQAHGAIGFTYEHSLHFSSRRLWAWRAEFGLAEEWATRLGDAVQDDFGGAVWPLVTSR